MHFTMAKVHRTSLAILLHQKVHTDQKRRISSFNLMFTIVAL